MTACPTRVCVFCVATAQRFIYYIIVNDYVLCVSYDKLPKQILESAGLQLHVKGKWNTTDPNEAAREKQN